jgi:excisionase family DNA binding protein
MSLVYSINETARALSLGRTSIYALIKQGRLETVKLGSRTLVKTSSIMALIGASEVAK